VQAVAGDMADESALDQLIEHHSNAFGTLNALIIAAGVGSAGAISDYPLRRFDKLFAVNARGPFALVSRALPMLRQGAAKDPDRGGRIIALASVEGVYPDPGLAAYGAAKAALISLVRSINIEEGANGIVATAISPGFVDTDMSAWTTDTIPADTMLPVSDIVKVVDLVLSVSRSAVLPHVLMNRAGASAYHA